jgi:glycosyltransferase involved in cell wall biosynthesis
MKINWFSPLPPAKTGIAHTTEILMPVLRKWAEITLWTDQLKWDESIEQWATVRRFDPEELGCRVLNNAEITFFNIGNNSLFHSAIWRASQRFKGVTILHDVRLQHFFESYYRTGRHDRAGYVMEMQRYYGETGRHAAEALWSGQCTIDEVAKHFPLTELALRNSLGVVVHTRPAFEEIKQMGRWPVGYLALPAAVRAACPLEQRAESRPPYKIIMFGHMGTNRRVESVLAAMAGLAQRNQFRLDIFGDLRDENLIRSKTLSLNLEEIVHVHGFVAEEVLRGALAAADLGINLRNPTMGEASASQLQLWEHCLPVLVSPVGFYVDFPADTMAFVRPESEIEDIQSHLRDFLAQPRRFREMGMRGRKLVEKHHTPEAYVEGLLQMAGRAREFGPDQLAGDLATRVGLQLGSLLSPDDLEPSCHRVAKEITAMLC